MTGLPGAMGLLEAAINRYLGLDPETLDALSKLSGRSVAVELRGLERTILLHITREGVHLTTNLDREPDALVRAPPGALLRAVAAQKPGKAAFDREVDIEGDAALVQELQSVLTRIDIDWEEVLSRYFGDTVSHQVGNVVRGVMRWGRQAGNTLMQDMAEYLTEEGRYAPQRDELVTFVKSVDRLRDDAERLEQRVRRLAAGQAGGGS